MIQAQLEDGRVLEFPEGTDPAVIQATVKRMVSQQHQPITPNIMAEANARRDIKPQGGPVSGAAEVVGTMASGALAEPVAGAFGTLAAANPFADQGAGARTVESIREGMTYEPRTETGQQYLQGVGSAVAGTLEAVNEIGRDLGLPDWMLKPIGDVVFEATGGNPEAATIAATLPTAIGELFALKGLQSLRSGTRLIDDAGNPTKALEKMLDKRGLVYDNLDPEVRAKIPEFATPNAIPSPKSERGLVAEQTVIEQINKGGRDDALAGLKVERGRLTDDPLGLAAVKQGFDPGFVQAVKTTSPQTRKAMGDMLTMMRRITKNRGLVAREGLRPTNVVGNAVLDRVKFIRGEADKARLRLDVIAKQSLPGQRINGEPVIKALQDELDKLNIRIDEGPNGVPRPVFEGSDISKDRTSQKIITDMIDLMAEGTRPDAYRAHRLKRQLDRMIDFNKKSAAGLTDAGRDAMKGVRASLNKVIRDVNPQYAEVNDILHSSLTALDDFNKATGPSINIFGEGADKAIGTNMRSLLSNRQTRINLDNSLKGLDKTAQELGGQFPVDYTDLVTFANGLEDRFGAVAQTSLKGEMESALKTQALDTAQQAATQGTTATAINQGFAASRTLLEKARGINDFNAFQAMQELIKRQD